VEGRADRRDLGATPGRRRSLDAREREAARHLERACVDAQADRLAGDDAGRHSPPQGAGASRIRYTSGAGAHAAAAVCEPSSQAGEMPGDYARYLVAELPRHFAKGRADPQVRSRQDQSVGGKDKQPR
jgi:hypothetical protein